MCADRLAAVANPELVDESVSVLLRALYASELMTASLAKRSVLLTVLQR